MMPNMLSPEQFLVEHVRERQREVKQRYWLASLQGPGRGLCSA